MKISTIICEFNPLHNGHVYHIEKTRSITNCDFLICLMNGNFVQRGEPAILDKYDRARHAIYAGADVVFELPTIYATANAEVFAKGALSLFKTIKADLSLSFGVENDNLDELTTLSNILLNEPCEVSKAIKHQLSSGLSYPTARFNAVKNYLTECNFSNETIDSLKSPNNILAIEYLKALNGTNITPVLVKRMGANHNEIDIKENMFSSASTIRNCVRLNDLDIIKDKLPSFVYESLLSDSLTDYNTFSDFVFYNLRTKSSESLSELYDVSEGLNNRLKEMANVSSNLDELISNLVSKRYTKSKIQRILLYSVLGINKNYYKTINCNYLKVLALKKSSKQLFADFCKLTSAKVVSTKSNYDSLDKYNKKIFDVDLLSENIYSLFKKPYKKSYESFRKGFPLID